MKLFAAAVMVLTLCSARAQGPAAEMGTMNPDSMPGADNGAGPESPDNRNSMNLGGRTGRLPMQGGTAPPDARDPHAYSDGYDFGTIPRPRFADEHNFAALLVDQLEYVRTNDDQSAAYDLQAWFGRDYDRAVFKAEGDYDSNKLQDARTELLWGHAVAVFWDTQLGIRHDSGEGRNRNWLAFGVQGLAPYWFEVEATGYLRGGNRAALRLDASYELLLTQKLILQPRIEANAYSKRDASRGLGDGLSDLVPGLRLRYEFRREIAPYIGVEWSRKFSDTKDFARAAGEDTSETRFVAGLRFLF
ncbi:MAG: copper resistance protein B [Thiohalobacterales bacterium]